MTHVSSEATPTNHLRFLRHWNPQAQEAIDWVCHLWPLETRRRGFARLYYEFLWLLDEILRILPKGVAGLNVLDVGCGAGIVPLALSHLDAHVTVLDRFSEYENGYDNQMGNTCDIVARFEANGIAVLRCDFAIGGLPVEPETYDLVTFLAVIEHLRESPQHILREIYHVLRPGGYVVITTPNHAWIRTRLRLLMGHSANYPLPEWWQTPFFGHVREYTMAELRSMLEWSGFQVARYKLSSWCHASSRIRGYTPGESETWTTRFTLGSLERWIIAASLLVSALFPSLRYTMLAVGRKPESE